MAPIPYDNLVLNFTDDIIINHHARLFRVSLTTNPCIFLYMYYLLILKLGIIVEVNKLIKYVDTNNWNSGFSNCFLFCC